MLHAKWKIGFALTALIVMGLGALPCTAALLLNGNMELGGSPTTPPTSWIVFAGDGIAGVTNDTPDGSSQSLSLLSTNGLFSSAVFQSVPLFEGAVQLSFSNKLSTVRWELWKNNFSTLLTADIVAGGPNWKSSTSPFVNVPVGTTNLQVVLYDVSDNGEPALFDNVQLNVFVPEPGSALLLGVGALVVGWCRRRLAIR